MALKPLQDSILLKPNQIEEVTPGGIIRPGTATNSQYLKGTVLEVGPGKYGPSGRWQVIKGITKGDVVLYDSNYAVLLDDTDADGNRLVLCIEGALLARDDAA